MNKIALNTVPLDGGDVIIKKGGGGGGVTINNQSKIVDITENGTTEVTADAGYTGLGKVTINTNVASSGGGGGGSASAGAVNFRDYDGTILHSFSADQFLAMAELPALPTRSGLTCQGWNYTLADAKEYVAEYGVLEVGASYITDDGKTRLYIKIAEKGRMTVPLCFLQTVANGVTIDWGDGSATQTLSGTGGKETTHTYADKGDYIITLDVAAGCTLRLGAGSSYCCVMGSTGDNGKVYCNMLQAVEIGKNVTIIDPFTFYYCYSLASIVIPQGVTSIDSNAFYYCYSLASVVIPQGVTSIGGNAFSDCHSLASVVIPQGVTSIGGNAFSDCHSLASVVIPQGVTSIGGNAFYYCYSLASVVIPQGVTSIGSFTFYNCYSLASVVIPQGVTSIGSNAFYRCYGMAFYDFRASKSVPTLSNTNAFSNIPNDCKIVVPDALYDTWKSASNWSNYTNKTIKASEFTE
jgi:hypothetical protein